MADPEINHYSDGIALFSHARKMHRVKQVVHVLEDGTEALLVSPIPGVTYTSDVSILVPYKFGTMQSSQR
jgi:hypothetical protein